MEAEIRVCDVSLIHCVTPRFNAMLQESHAIGNASHKFFFMFAPIVFLYTLQFIGELFKSVSEGEVDKVEGEVVRCVETWVFFALFQPLISFIIFVHSLKWEPARREERNVSKKDRQRSASKRVEGKWAQNTLLKPRCSRLADRPSPPF